MDDGGALASKFACSLTTRLYRAVLVNVDDVRKTPRNRADGDEDNDDGGSTTTEGGGGGGGGGGRGSW